MAEQIDFNYFQNKPKNLHYIKSVKTKTSLLINLLWNNFYNLGHCAHEFIVDCRAFRHSADVEVIDIAKRLQDYGNQ